MKTALFEFEVIITPLLPIPDVLNTAFLSWSQASHAVSSHPQSLFSLFVCTLFEHRQYLLFVLRKMSIYRHHVGDIRRIQQRVDIKRLHKGIQFLYLLCLCSLYELTSSYSSISGVSGKMESPEASTLTGDRWFNTSAVLMACPIPYSWPPSPYKKMTE